MSFATDFSSIAGSLTNTFTSVWGALNAPPRVQIPAVQPSQGGAGVGAALQKAAATTNTPQLIMYILLGAAGIVLSLAFILIAKKK